MWKAINHDTNEENEDISRYKLTQTLENLYKIFEDSAEKASNPSLNDFDKHKKTSPGGRPKSVKFTINCVVCKKF